MTKIRNILFFLFSLFLASHVNAQTDCSSFVGSCTYYQCLNESLACDSSSYMSKFGAPYCQKFVDLDEDFSPVGQRFSASVRECLQLNMERDSEQIQCGSAREIALKHHIECYMRNDFCHLPLVDKNIILKVALPQFFKIDFLATAIKMNLLCLNP